MADNYRSVSVVTKTTHWRKWKGLSMNIVQASNAAALGYSQRVAPTSGYAAPALVCHKRNHTITRTTALYRSLHNSTQVSMLLFRIFLVGFQELHTNQAATLTCFDDVGMSAEVTFSSSLVDGSMMTWLVRGMVSPDS